MAKTYTLARDGHITRITITRSDGDPSEWPTNTTRIVKDGKVDYFDEPPEKMVKKWKKDIGIDLAEVVLREKGETLDAESCMLHSWPEGYKMFVHRTGSSTSPRQDYYLFGHHSKFRSGYEFAIHAAWLIRGQPRSLLGATLCKCKWCSTSKDESWRAELGPTARGMHVRTSSEGGPHGQRSPLDAPVPRRIRPQTLERPVTARWEGSGPAPGGSSGSRVA